MQVLPSDIWSTVKGAPGEMWRRYNKLPFAGKAFVWFLIILHVALIVLFVSVHPDKIFQFLYNQGRNLRESKYGILVVTALIIVTSIPPLIGFSTILTVVGFAWGVRGWFLAAPLAILASTFSFLLLRLLFQNRMKSFTTSSTKWQAMEAVVRHHGLWLIVLCRICPMPWAYSNAFFASIETIRLWQFIFATVCLTPRLLLHVFIASRIALFSDGETRGQMDTTTKIVNALSMVLGMVLGAGTGIIIYRLTLRKIRELEGTDPETDELAAEALEDAERRALLGAEESRELED
ncbi:Golgi apparatus membrane protein TVP38 [Dacryopinax primogenitus]|uniref:Golgi apparatus membrane protein TVP38 n=1 Tax=Dacryopinax primogenitus (strain DJM 731) TaxID=1858805 RepID=M5GBC7_DACPD|nr:Golgi apparatus membrane protein TVP38 [Dacryopinax primogenitus]EJU06249.1 Golgi apparatus membrane protein TVP38 [Dacryopinax primogenitus]